MNKENRIKTTFSASQWEIIYAKVMLTNKEKNKRTALRSYVQSELNRLESICNTMPDSSPCLECKEQVSISLPNPYFKKLAVIAKKTGVTDPGLIISKFIINPLLLRDS